jgi:integrase/recombinase XerD
MLETHFVKPETVDRIRTSWIGAEIERYVGWLADEDYGARTVWRRIPLASPSESSRANGCGVGR